MALPANQAQMEACIQTTMLEYLANLSDAVYGMLHPRFVQCDYEKKSLEVVVNVAPWMRNNNGVVHGGVIAAALDGVGGLMTRCYVAAGHIAPTTDLSVSYLLPVPMDTQLHVRVIAVHTGRRLLHFRSEAFVISDGAERVCASGAATYCITD